MRVDDILHDLRLLEEKEIVIEGYGVCWYDIDYTPNCEWLKTKDEFVGKIKEYIGGDKRFSAIIKVVAAKYRISIYYPFKYELDLWGINELRNKPVITGLEDPIRTLLSREVYLKGYPIIEGRVGG